MINKSAKVLDKHDLDRPMLIKEKLFSIMNGDVEDAAVARLQEDLDYHEWVPRG